MQPSLMETARWPKQPKAWVLLREGSQNKQINQNNSIYEASHKKLYINEHPEILIQHMHKNYSLEREPPTNITQGGQSSP